MVAAVGAGTAISAIPASAATPGYGVNALQACRDTYAVSHYHYTNIYVGYTSFSNPNSWNCTYQSAPGMARRPLGAPNFQDYCSVAYPGSRAVVASRNINGWRCQR
jgi:hypothetical protein